MPQDNPNNPPQLVYRYHTTKRIVRGENQKRQGQRRGLNFRKKVKVSAWDKAKASLRESFGPNGAGGAINRLMRQWGIPTGRLKYGTGNELGGAGEGSDWQMSERTPEKERKVSVVTPTVTTVNKQPVSTSQPKPNNRRRRPIRRQPVEQPTTQMPNISFNPVAIPINTEFTAPEIIETPQIQQEPIHYTRKMVRDYLRAKGEHPYDYGAFNRRALRHYLNGDKPIKQKYYRKIQDTVAAPYKDNNTPVTTLTDLGDIFLKRND